MKLVFNQNQTTNTDFISTPPFYSKITNNLHFLETEFYSIDLRINLECSLHHYIDQFVENGYLFSHIDEMNISTINDTQSMTHLYNIHEPMPPIQRRKNIILAENPHRSHIHPLIKKFSHIPFNT